MSVEVQGPFGLSRSAGAAGTLTQGLGERSYEMVGAAVTLFCERVMVADRGTPLAPLTDKLIDACEASSGEPIGAEGEGFGAPAPPQ